MNTSFSSISLTKITTILDEAKQTLDAIDIKIQDTSYHSSCHIKRNIVKGKLLSHIQSHQGNQNMFISSPYKDNQYVKNNEKFYFKT